MGQSESQRARGGLRLLLQEHLPHTWATGAAGCNSISKVVKKPQLFTTTKTCSRFNLEILQNQNISSHPVWQVSINLGLLPLHLTPNGDCDGRHSGDGGDLIRYVLVFVPPAFSPLCPPTSTAAAAKILIYLSFIFH